MLILRILILILTSRAGRCVEFSLSKNANSYGPYVLDLKQIELCQGPKSTNVTKAVVQIIANETNALVAFNMSYLFPVRVSEIRIHVSHMNGMQKTKLWNYRVDKPCQHFAIASIMAKYLSIQQNCIIKKGELYYVVDFTAISRQFFGETFFYGDFVFKSLALSQQGNIMCANVNMAFIKKKD